MCGIFGFQAADRRLLPDSSVLDGIVADLQHRGPDAHGHLSLDQVALAHTRLALLDLDDRANQPMWDRSGRYCILYNGEIYNFRELRATLTRAGCRFVTESDTEVLLCGLIHEGPEILPKLQGMFAFALYDSKERRFLLGRDRFGIKPLVYTATN